MGNKEITNEEMLTYLKDPKNDRWLKAGKKSAPAKVATKAVANPATKPTKKAGKVTNVQNIFGTTTPTPVKPGP
jgi:hypothetical protein